MSDGSVFNENLDRFAAFCEPLIGLPLSLLWRGYGSAIFLEFGDLVPWFLRNGRRMNHDRGEMGLGITWSWRIEDSSSIIAGSWSEEEQWPAIFDRLGGVTVKSVSLFGRLPEVQVEFSNGLYLCSVMTADGDPEWAISKRLGGQVETVCVKAGSLAWELSDGDLQQEKS
jgi:hypothetical protein